jgi:hypothetical protein
MKFYVFFLCHILEVIETQNILLTFKGLYYGINSNIVWILREL